MMKFYFTFLSLLIISFILSCNTYYSKKAYLLDTTVKEKEAIIIDRSYDYYIRQLYVEKENGDKNIKAFTQKNATDKLIEVEYLFVSPQTRNVIYIATRPDKYQRYYADTTTYFGESKLNADDFRVLFFGKLLSNNAVEFISADGKDKDIWHVEINNVDTNNFVTLQRIENYKKGEFVNLVPVDKALDKAISFKKVDDYEIILKTRGNDFIAKNLDNTVHFRKNGNEYEVFLSFSNIDSLKKTNVIFRPRRIRYSPVPLFE